jgi:hypothetical protein
MNLKMFVKTTRMKQATDNFPSLLWISEAY